MLRLTLTLVRRGNERDQVPLGTVEIENVGGTEELGNYHVRMRGTVHRDAELTGYERGQGHWPLVSEALRKLLREKAIAELKPPCPTHRGFDCEVDGPHEEHEAFVEGVGTMRWGST